MDEGEGAHERRDAGRRIVKKGQEPQVFTVAIN
jgi:hypothetical protein